MSLQLDLLLNFVQLKASPKELDKIIDKAILSRLKQIERQALFLDKYWNEIYQDWSLPFNPGIKSHFPIKRTRSDGKVLYHIECTPRVRIKVRDKCTQLYFADPNNAEFEDCNDCWVEITSDGSNSGCLSDGCGAFLSLTKNKDFITYVNFFRFDLYVKMVSMKSDLQKRCLGDQ